VSTVESRSLREPAASSQQSLLALSWLNFFLSGMQTAFGPIAAACRAIQGWTAKDIGFALTIGGTASLVSQVPGGALVDAVRAKRLLVATGVVTVAFSVLIFRLWPSFPLVALAEVLRGSRRGGRRSLPLPSDWSAAPVWRNGLDATSASRLPAAFFRPSAWRSTAPPLQCLP